MIIGNTDFDALSSTDGLKAVTDHSGNGVVVHKMLGHTVGFDVDFNSRDATPYALIGAGKRDRKDVDVGQVFSAESDTHSATGIGPGGDDNWRIVGVGVATQPNANKTRHEVAVVTGLSTANQGGDLPPSPGIWYRNDDNNQNWTYLSSTSSISDSDTEFTRIPIEWGRKVSMNGNNLNYTKHVFLLDRDSGIWRSKN